MDAETLFLASWGVWALVIACTGALVAWRRYRAAKLVRDYREMISRHNAELVDKQILRHRTAYQRKRELAKVVKLIPRDNGPRAA